MKIYAPVKDFNGLRANVMFVKGVGETNDPYLVHWFKIHGYKVEICDEPSEIPPEKCEETSETSETTETSSEPDFDAMNPNELREWMKANGFGLQIKNIRNKEKLLEIIRG